MDSIAVIVTTRDNAAVVRRTLQGVEEALAVFRDGEPRVRDVAAEVVIVDDGSADETYALLLDFTRSRPGWKAVRRAAPGGGACVRNTGAANSRGDLLFFLDGDHLFLPGHVLECYRALQDRTLGFVKTGVRLAEPVHPDWKAKIAESGVVNLCVRRFCHDFIGGFPDYHLVVRRNDTFQPETDLYHGVEDRFYNQILNALFQGKRVAAETVQAVRSPGNFYDRQAEKFKHAVGSYPTGDPPDRPYQESLCAIIVKQRTEDLQRQLARTPSPMARVTAPPDLNRARQLHQAGDVAQAEVLYRQYVQAHPDNAQAWYLLGAACQTLGKLIEAEEAQRQAIRVQPNHADAPNHLGVTLARLGRYPEAADAFRQALRFKPDSAEVHNNLGLALKELNELDEAAAAYREALRLRPGSAEALNNLGVVLAAQGKPDEAAAAYQEAIRLRPDFLKARANLRQLLRDQGQLERVLADCREAVRARPDSAEAHNDLGRALMETGRAEESVAAFQEAVRLRPDSAEIHNNLGLALAGQGQYDEAIPCYREALRLNPEFAQAHNNLGMALRHKGKAVEAEACCREAARLAPDFPEAHNNLGLALMELERMDEAQACLEEAVRLRPSFAQAHNNLGILFWRRGQLARAMEGYAEALRLRPDFAEALNNLGNVLRDQGRFAEAEEAFEKSLRMKPDYVDPHWNRALLWLLQGDFARGWPEYEWRWKLKTFTSRRLIRPMWDGAPLAGKTILLHAEQGLGDTIHFVRYAALVKRQGATVIGEVQAPLLKLLAGFAGFDQLVPQKTTLPPFDLHAPLLSLPLLFKTDLTNIPADVPYLQADAKLVERWHAELGRGRSFKVGIAWKGSSANRADHWRSIPLAQFEPLAKKPGVELVSLQKGPGSEQVREVAGRFAVRDLGDRLDAEAGPFMDTAAIMKNLDLVITCDTVLAHLAGALGVPVWIALHAVPDWRWLLDREDSPWYPTARLFRQTRLGEWEEVFQRMARALP